MVYMGMALMPVLSMCISMSLLCVLIMSMIAMCISMSIAMCIGRLPVCICMLSVTVRMLSMLSMSIRMFCSMLVSMLVSMLRIVAVTCRIIQAVSMSSLVGFALCLLRVYDAHDDAIAGVLHVLDVQLLLHRFHGDVGLRREGQERQTPEEQRPHGSDLMADPLRSKFAPLGWT